MPTTDTSEKGLEALIVRSLIDEAGYIAGASKDFDRDHGIDLVKLFAFLNATQPEAVEALGIGEDGPKRLQFLHRLQGEIAKRGVIDVLRNGVKHGPGSVELFFGTPTPSNAKAEELFAANIFSVTRQLHYSKDATKLSLDAALFINGLPITAPARIRHRTRTSCAPSAGHGAGGGGWKQVSSPRSRNLPRPSVWPNAMSAASCASPILRRRCSNA